MPLDLKNLPDPVAQQLREFHRRKRLFELLRVVLAVGIVYLLSALVVMHLDRLLFLDGSTRVQLTGAVHMVGIVFAVMLLGVFLLRRRSARRLAYELEERLPADMAERYVTLAELAEAPETENLSDVSRSLLEQLRREASEYSRTFRAGRLVRDRRLKLLGAAALAVAGIYGLLLVPADYQFPLMVQRFLHPRADLPKPSFVSVEVTPTEAVIGKGGEIVIQARTRGAMPAAIEWLFERLGTSPDHCYLAIGSPQASDSTGREASERAANAPQLSPVWLDPAAAGEVVVMNRIRRDLFVFSRTDLQDSFEFQVRCADGQTAVYSAEVVTQPEITELRLAITPPEHTNLPARTVEGGETAVQLYPGSNVVLEFATDQPVVERRIRLGEEAVEAEWDSAGRTGRYAFVFQEDLDVQVEVVNDRGFANLAPARLSLHSLQDQKPVITLSHPAGDLVSVPGELVPLEFEVEDDLGIREVVVQYMLNPDETTDHSMEEIPVELPLSRSPSRETAEEGEGRASATLDTHKRVALSTTLDLDQAGAVPSDNVQVFIRARDTAGNDGESRAISIRIEAFARGENERRRLRVLDFLASALRVAAEAPVAAGATAIEQAAYDKILESAERISLPLNPAPSVESLLARLELECHFTDEPQYKQDVRMLAGIVREATMSSGSASREASATDGKRTSPAGGGKSRRSEVFKALSEETLRELTLYRRLKNLTWRVFGLGYEANSVREKIRGIQTHRESMRLAQRELAADYLAGLVTAVQQDDVHQELLKKKAGIQKSVRQVQAKIKKEQGGDRPPFSSPGGMPRVQVPGRGQDTAAVRKLRSQLSDLAAETSALDKELEKRLALIQQQAAAKHPDVVRSLHQQHGRDTLARAASRAVSAATDKQVSAKDAALDVAARLLEAAEMTDGPLDAALNRRTALYLETVGEVGAELLALAETEAALDEQACRAAQGDLVSTVYHIARKEDSLTRRALACDQVNEKLRKLHGLLIPLLPEYAQREQQARGTLQEAFDAARNRVGSRTRENSGESRLTADAKGATRRKESWLLADMRMMGFNPYAPLWPYVRDLELLEGNVRGSIAPPTANADPAEGDTREADNRVPSAARREWLQSRILAFDRRLDEVIGMDRIGAAEKRLAGHLIGLEASLALGPEIAVHPPSFYAEKIKTFALDHTRQANRRAGGSPEASARPETPASHETELEGQLPKRLLEICPVRAQALSGGDSVVGEALAEQWLVSRDPVALLVETADAMQQRESMFDELRVSLAGSDNPAAEIGRLLELTRRDVERIEELVMLLRLKLAYAPGSVSESHELLFLMIRQSLGRYEVRSDRAAKSLSAMSRSKLSAADLTRGTTDIASLGHQHQALRSDIHQFAAQLRSGELLDEETRQKYPLLDTFRRTAGFVAAARQSLASEDPASVAERFLADFPEAAVSHFVSQRDALEAARDQLTLCNRELRAGAPDAATYRDALAQARRSLAEFRSALALAGNSGVPAQLSATLQSLDARVRNLDLDLDTAADIDVRARMFALGEIMQTLERTFGVLDLAARQTRDITTNFTGAPDNTWIEANRRSANHARSRIEGLARYADGQVALGVLGGLQGPRDEPHAWTSLAWSRLLYRLVRSPLTGPVVIKTAGADRGAAAEPLVAWLLEELEEAENQARQKGKLKHYSERTLEWIRSMKDYLRY